MPEEVVELEQQRRMEAERLAQMQQLSHQDDDSAAAAARAAQTGERKVGRNDPCPCGSGWSNAGKGSRGVKKGNPVSGCRWSVLTPMIFRQPKNR